MSNADEKARQARAKRLREQIEAMKEQTTAAEEKTADDASAADAPPAESPRDFIERRMRELEAQKQKKKE